MKKLLTITAIVLMATTTAHAGRATMKNSSGAKMKLWCNNSGCFVKQKAKGGKWSGTNRIGAGGRPNFLKQRDKYKSRGWK